MIDFDKMTVAERERYKEMERKANVLDKSIVELTEERLRLAESVLKQKKEHGEVDEKTILILKTYDDIISCIEGHYEEGDRP